MKEIEEKKKESERSADENFQCNDNNHVEVKPQRRQREMNIKKEDRE